VAELLSFGGIDRLHKIMNPQQPRTKRKNCRSGTAISISIALGAAIGAAFGAATNDMAASVAWGVAVGAAVGAVLTFTKTRCD
jgi:F0F1-type ATP synthase assembly protein I